MTVRTTAHTTGKRPHFALWAVTLSAAFSLATTARGETTTGGTAGTGFSLDSTAHMGFAVAESSSTGFDEVGGSLMFLDVTTPLAEDLHGGLRSLGQGGRSDRGEFYRMGAGPVLTWGLTETWSLHGSAQYFKETGLDGRGRKAYRSQGHVLMLGYQREFRLSEAVAFQWGGFLMQHQGDISHLAAATGGSHFADSSSNHGFTHGIEVAIRTSL